jgi:hypothetical protein
MEIKDAVRSAVAFAKDSLGLNRTIDVRLEEIESSIVDGRPVWLITLSSALQPDAAIAKMFAPQLGFDAEREYKIFTVAKDDGEILSMKIRVLALPMK